MTDKINSHDVKVLATGIAIGGSVATLVLSNWFRKVHADLVTRNTLKHQFITWMFTTGLDLPEAELYKAAEAEWKFINQVTLD